LTQVIQTPHYFTENISSFPTKIKKDPSIILRNSAMNPYAKDKFEGFETGNQK